MRGLVMEPEFFGGDVQDIELRHYQSESIEVLRANVRNARRENAGHIAQVLSCATGSGKTIMGAYLLRECWQNLKSGIFVVDRTNLLNQTSVVFQKFGIPHGVIGGKHPRYRPSELIQIASVHTIAKRGWPKGELIVVDECHIGSITTRKKLERKDAEVIGLTATPFARGMGKIYSSIVNVTTTNELTKEGFLCPFKVWAAKEPDMKGVPTGNFGEWKDAETSKRAVKIVGDVVREYQDKGDNGKAIAFGVDVAHCEEMARQFLGAGIQARLYTYHTSDEEREYLIGEHGEFRKPDSIVRVLISVAALSRGFDVPDVSVIIMCRPLRTSFMEFLQVIGRGLRAYPGKTHVRILDLAGNFARHYPAMVEFYEEGCHSLDDGKPKPKRPIEIPEAKKPRICPKCKYLPVIGQTCPACGYIYPPNKSVLHEAGKLDQFDGATVLKYDRAAKTQLYAELSWIQIDRRYKKGWTGHKYRGITGVWPTGMMGVIPTRPTAATIAAVDRISPKRPSKPTGAILDASRAIPEELNLFI